MKPVRLRKGRERERESRQREDPGFTPSLRSLETSWFLRLCLRSVSFPSVFPIKSPFPSSHFQLGFCFLHVKGPWLTELLLHVLIQPN